MDKPARLWLESMALFQSYSLDPAHKVSIGKQMMHANKDFPRRAKRELAHGNSGDKEVRAIFGRCQEAGRQIQACVPMPIDRANGDLGGTK